MHALARFAERQTDRPPIRACEGLTLTVFGNDTDCPTCTPSNWGDMSAVRKKEVAAGMSEQEKARADAIMKGWLAFNAKVRDIETAYNANTAEIGRAVADLVADKIGLKEDLIGHREEEFGRLIGDAIRTFQMKLPYHHQANDALIKEQLKTIDWGVQTGNLEALVQHDIDSMYEILHERVYWIEQTGDHSLALDAVTTPTCFRNLTVGQGFQWHGPMKVSWVSPYKRILEKGWLRGIWTSLTEQKIHELWTVPRFEGYARHLDIHFDISDWNEDDRIIYIAASALD